MSNLEDYICKFVWQGWGSDNKDESTDSCLFLVPKNGTGSTHRIAVHPDGQYRIESKPVLPLDHKWPGMEISAGWAAAWLGDRDMPSKLLPLSFPHVPAPSSATQKQCVVCGNQFEAKRPDATMCGNTCRVRAKRQREKEGAATTEAPQPAKGLQRWLPQHHTIIRWDWLHIEVQQELHGGWMAKAHIKIGGEWNTIGNGVNGLDNAINGLLVDMPKKLEAAYKASFAIHTAALVQQYIDSRMAHISKDIADWRSTFNPVNTPIIIIQNP